MIKRIRFGDRDAGAAEAAATAPPGLRPTRVESYVALHDVIPDPRHDAVVFEWFEDEAHLRRSDAGLGVGVDADPSTVVLADEHVMRGEDWLERRRLDGSGSLVHVAIAKRADGLSLEQFVDRWAAKAGRVRRGGDDDATVIPERVRGLAYVQNRPRPRADGDWAYDAINEVYFDDVDDLVARVEWFRELGDRPDPDLFSANWFLAIARSDASAST